jgi:hypothetical protein
MTILNEVKKLYDRLGMDMFRDISMYMEHGYVFKGPDYFLLGKGVKKDGGDPKNQWNVKCPDAWYVQAAVGDNQVSHFIKCIPYPLPFVGWKRRIKDKGIQWFEFDKLQRRIEK